mgnify:FL=1
MIAFRISPNGFFVNSLRVGVPPSFYFANSLRVGVPDDFPKTLIFRISPNGFFANYLRVGVPDDFPLHITRLIFFYLLFNYLAMKFGHIHTVFYIFKIAIPPVKARYLPYNSHKTHLSRSNTYQDTPASAII